MRFSSIVRIALPALAAATAACFHNTPVPIDPGAKAVLEVDNQGFDNLDIFALPVGGVERRLGVSTPKRQVYFDIPSDLLSAAGVRGMRFIARPIASQRGPISDDVNVVPGDTIVMTIPPG